MTAAAATTAVQAPPRSSPWRTASRRLGPLGISALVVVSVVVLLAVFAPVIAPNPNNTSLLDAFAAPSSAHLLGADALGRNIAARLVWGARTSLVGPLLVVTGSTSVGVLLAIVAAWCGGWLDAVISRVFDVTFAFPSIMLAMLFVAVFGPGFLNAAIAVAIAYIPWVGRITRGAALQQVKLPYITAATVAGHAPIAIARRHLLPNLLPGIVALMTVNFGYAVIDLAAISYLGFGVQSPTPDWGSMVASGQNEVIQGHPNQVLAASVMIVLVVVAIAIVGQRLFDERVELLR
jgi:peptide/nickel transport system permease protein